MQTLIIMTRGKSSLLTQLTMPDSKNISVNYEKEECTQLSFWWEINIYKQWSYWKRLKVVPKRFHLLISLLYSRVQHEPNPFWNDTCAVRHICEFFVYSSFCYIFPPFFHSGSMFECGRDQLQTLWWRLQEGRLHQMAKQNHHARRWL